MKWGKSMPAESTAKTPWTVTRETNSTAINWKCYFHIRKAL